MFDISCISFDSYIKPQPPILLCYINIVVYLLIPTSNHNSSTGITWCTSVVYLLIPTSNHNQMNGCRRSSLLYIFWFLHQTTTKWTDAVEVACCISFDSYIKPQHSRKTDCRCRVVYLLIPTSNHNIPVINK